MELENPLRGRQTHKTAVCIFTVLLFYNFVVILRCMPPEVSINYTHYAVDFSFGWCSRLLPGAVYNLFVPEPSEVTANVYVYLLMLLFLAAVSLLLERLLYSLSDQDRPMCYVLLAFYLTGPATFSPYFFAFGMLDFHWLVLMVPFFVLLQKRWGRWLVWLFPALLMFVSFGAALTWAPLCGLLILYELALAKEKKTRRQLTVVFFAAVILAAGIFLYITGFETKTLTYSLDEFNEILDERGVKIMNYYDGTFYGDMAAAEKFYVEKYGEKNNPFSSGVVSASEYYFNPDTGLAEGFLNALRTRLAQHWFIYSDKNFIQLKKTALFLGFLMTVLLPPFVVLYRSVLVRWQRAGKDLLKRFLYVCLLIFFPAVILLSVIVSIDSTRWVMHTFMMLFTFVLYQIYREKEAVLPLLRASLRKIPRFAVFIYYGIYCFTFVSPYVYA